MAKNGNFPLLYVLKMSLCRGVGGSKKAKTPLRNIKMVPYLHVLRVIAIDLLRVYTRTFIPKWQFYLSILVCVICHM